MSSKFAFRSIGAFGIVLLTGALGTAPAVAGYIFSAGVSETVYGVADYGGLPVSGPPQYILNSVTHLNSVLASPGGGFLTADPSNANNLVDTGPVGIPYYSAKSGGSNGNGSFGAGQVLLTPNLVGFSLLDINPDGSGAAAYSVASMISTFIEDGTGFALAEDHGNISVGTWLAASGVFGSSLSASAVALTVLVESANVLSPFFNGGNGRSYELVLAAAAIGNFNSVAYSDINNVVQTTAAIFNNGVDPFYGLAIASELLPVAGMMGDTITVTTTLTVISDPYAGIEVGDLSDSLSLLNITGALPNLSIMGSTPVPEPGTLTLVGLGAFGFVAGAMRSRRRRVFPK